MVNKFRFFKSLKWMLYFRPQIIIRDPKLSLFAN